MKFQTFFELSLTHDYYTQGYCPDFTILPTLATAKLLRDHRAVLKTGTSGLRILLTTDSDGKPFITMPGGRVFTFQLQLQNRDFVLFTDLSDAATQGLLKSLNNPGDNLRVTVHISPQRLINGSAQIEIHIDTLLSQLSAPHAHFDIAFRAKKVHWEYYLVTNLSGPPEDLQIIDNNGDGSVDFEKSTTAAGRNSLLDRLAIQYPQMQHLHFVSKEPLTCRQVARRNIQLRLNGDRLLDHLPNPALHNFIQPTPSTDANTGSGAALFEIVKYITHPFTTNGI